MNELTFSNKIGGQYGGPHKLEENCSPLGTPNSTSIFHWFSYTIILVTIKPCYACELRPSLAALDKNCLSMSLPNINF